MRPRAALTALCLTALALTAAAPAKPDGNRLTYLDGDDPYYPHLGFAKLVTPQWVGEEGVEAVVVLAVDDMRDPARYEAFLRPILNRLKAIDGRAPVSIMTNQVKPDDPRLRGWLKEGLSIEVHTLTHPCPLLQKGDFAAARDTVDGCTDLLHKIPGNRPVAFRMPCCDSLNTPSPRFFAEIFNRTTPAGHFLTIDSSVFQVFTPADPSLPRDLVTDPGGGERFRKYLPFPSFVNTIENYPYPYVLGRLCWEFPCVVPSDWEAQNLHKPNNPRTVDDLTAALDAVVLKQGVFNLVFHPHGWIKSEQVVDLIDRAVKKHGKKVKFLNFREAQERIDENLLGGQPLRDAKGDDNGVRVLDLDNDGYMDVIVGNDRTRQTRVWEPKARRWRVGDLPVPLLYRHGIGEEKDQKAFAAQFGVLRPDGHASMIVNIREGTFDERVKEVKGGWHFDGTTWAEDAGLLSARLDVMLDVDKELRTGSFDHGDLGARLRDIDGDGVCELLYAGLDPLPNFSQVFAWSEGRWRPLPFRLPEGARFVGGPIPSGLGPDDFAFAVGSDAGLRFADLDEDGRDDVIFSNDAGFGIYLFASKETGWSRRVTSGKAGGAGAIPRIARAMKVDEAGGVPLDDVLNNGFWVHSRRLWWQNEDTARLPDLVDRRSFNDLLKNVVPEGKTAEASRAAIRVRPGFKVELAASEPLVLDPIAFDWGADGRLWVVEMGDYPLGADGHGKPGGQVRVLEDTDRDGRYDKATVFLDGLGFPTGVMPWRNGVLVACAPEIFYAEDRDGDGRADRRDVLFTGFTPGNQQHRLNGFELGLDGWVYGANGDSGGVVRSVKTGKTVDIRGSDFRFRPDDGRFEAEVGQTQYGRHRDDWGHWFGDDNPTWAWQFVLTNADLRRNPTLTPPARYEVLERDTRLFAVSRLQARFNDLHTANRVTSANSPTPYRDDLFGPHFMNSLFVSEPVHNLVHRMVLEPDGPVLRGRRATGEADREFLASADNWFRPTMLKTGPDGALWVADMDRAVIEHPEWIPDDWEARLDLRAGHDRGRLFRVLPVDKSPRPFPRLDTLDTAGLVAALDSPNGCQRDTAHRLLLHKNDPSAAGPLRRLVAATPNPKAKVQALWVLENLGALTPEPVLSGLDDAHAQVRRNAVRVAERLLNGAPTVGEAVLRRVNDPDPEVRLQVALSLGHWDDPRAGRALAGIARRDRENAWSQAAVLISAPSHVTTLLQAFFGKDATGEPPGFLVRPLLALAGDTRNRPALLDAITAVGKPASPSGRYAAWQFSAYAGLLDASKGDVRALFKSGDAGLSSAVDRLDALRPAARKTADDPSAPDEERIAALALLGRRPDERDADRALAASLLKPQVSGRVQLAAVAAAARGGDPKLPEALLAGWRGHSPALRAAVLDTLLSRREWTGALLSSLEDTCTPPAEIDPAHRAALLGHEDRRFRERAAAVFGPANAARGPVIAAYRDALKTPGDASAGASVFKRLCASCHRFGGAGTEVGPDLAALTDRSPEALLTAILDPNRAFEAKYTSFTAHLADGRVLTGMIAAETPAALTLRRQNGEQDVVPRADIEALAGSGQSLMPEGLEKDLTKRDLADLIAYLASPPQGK